MSPDEPRRKALVIAVSEYDHLDKLDFCKNDGNEVGKLLKELDYDIKKQLVGKVDGTSLQDEIIEFFGDPEIKHNDTVLFYYSGHGVPGNVDDVYLASSNIDPTIPMKRGFSFDELATMMGSCRSKCLVVMLDCCYSGSAKLSKGVLSARSKIAQNYQSEKINNIEQGEGKCLLSSSLGFQESFVNAEGVHSFFTNYLLKGLRGADGKSVDNDGIVTPESLMQYIDSEIDNLPVDKRPSQTPLRKIETVGKISLAIHPKFAKKKRVKDELLSILRQKPSEQRSLAVGLIKNTSGQISTCFLIGSNIIMTDKSVLPTKESAISSSVIFGDQINDEILRYAPSQGITMPKNKSYELDPSDIFLTSKIGYTIVSTKGTPGDDYGFIPLSSYQCALQPKRSLYSIYYTQFGKIVDQNNNILLDDEGNFDKIIFESEASEMNVGAPIFDTNWNLLSMHGGYSNGGILPMFDHSENMIHHTRRIKRKLQGIRMIAIARDIENLCKMEDNMMACKILSLLH